MYYFSTYTLDFKVTFMAMKTSILFLFLLLWIAIFFIFSAYYYFHEILYLYCMYIKVGRQKIWVSSVTSLYAPWWWKTVYHNRMMVMDSLLSGPINPGFMPPFCCLHSIIHPTLSSWDSSKNSFALLYPYFKTHPF